jgi:hypothetical protein
LWISGELVAGGFEHCDDGFVGAVAHLADDLCGVEIGADGVEGDAGFDTSHFGCEECGDECGRLQLEGLASLFAADGFDGVGDFVEVAFEDGLQERALVGEVLIQGADGDAGSCGDSCGGQAILSDVEQNLKGRFENRFDAGGGTSLNGRFAGV